MAGMTAYLIGLPGCGKTTLGRAAAEAEDCVFCDLDAAIEKAAGMSIERIFEAEDEEGFRLREAGALAKIAGAGGPRRVISTGGGIVERAANRDAMRETGRVIFIDRPARLIMESLDASRRPLLAASPERLFELERRRRALYESCCHHTIINLGFDEALGELRGILRGLLS